MKIVLTKPVQVDLILAAIDIDHAKLMADSEDKEEVAAISRVTMETHWKLKLYRYT